MGSHRVGHDWSDLAAAAAGEGLYSCETCSMLPFLLSTLLEAESIETESIKIDAPWTLFTLKYVGSSDHILSITESLYLFAAAAKLLQSCPTLCDLIDRSPPGSPIPGILQARTLEWVAISFSNAWKWKVKVKLLSHVRLFTTPWTAAYQPPPSMGFSRQEYWSGCHCLLHKTASTLHFIFLCN